MAVTTALSRNVRKIGSVIRAFAASEGVEKDHLALIGILDRRTERIYLSVGVDRPIDRTQWDVDIQEAIRLELGYVPSVAHLGITIHQVDDLYAFYDRITVDDDALDLTDML